MRLLITGSDKVYAIENLYVKYLRKLGIELLHFPAQSWFYDYYQKNLFNKLVYQSGFSSVLKEINQSFKSKIEAFRPDIIWIFKGMEIFPQSLEWARSKGILLVNFNGDSPFIFSGKGSGNENVSNSIGLYDLFLTYNREDKKQMESKKIRAEILPFGFDLEENLLHECEHIQEINRVCFLGNPDDGRGKFITDLAKNGVEIDVYGNNWKRYVNHSNISIQPPVYGDDFWRTLRKYRVQLNLMRPHNLTTHNMRTFESAGAGAIQLAPATEDHHLYFEENKEIFLFKDVESCRRKIMEIEGLPIDKANTVRKNARQRSLADGYSYEKRSEQAHSFLKTLLNQ
jgi:spore maturation protein CgeB